VGKAPLLPESLPFLNLPQNVILELWEAFNDIAEGFGLTLDEYQEIIRVTLKDYLSYSEKKMNAIALASFQVFDDDENSLIDALEFLSSFALLSGMTVEEKMRYIFGIYDFDESGLLSVDEMTLALRSSISGLTKLSGIDPPSESEIEQISVSAFEEAPTSGSDAGMISRDKFVEYAVKTPEISSWINYYGDLDEVEVESFGGETFSKQLVKREGMPELSLKRDSRSMATMDLDNGSEAWLQIEEKGYSENFVPLEPWQNTGECFLSLASRNTVKCNTENPPPPPPNPHCRTTMTTIPPPLTTQSHSPSPPQSQRPFPTLPRIQHLT